MCVYTYVGIAKHFYKAIHAALKCTVRRASQKNAVEEASSFMCDVMVCVSVLVRRYGVHDYSITITTMS